MPFDHEAQSRHAQETRHPAEHVELGAFDVDLHQVRIAVDEIVETLDRDLEDPGHLGIDAVSIEAVHRADIAAQEELASLPHAPGGDRRDAHVGQSIRLDVLAQHHQVVDGRLHGEDAPARTDALRRVDGIDPDVGAGVHDEGAGREKRIHEAMNPPVPEHS